MRRSDKQIKEPGVAEQIFQNCPIGYLALTLPNGYPRAIPLNFVYNDGKIYFHGARAGEKFELAMKQCKAGFIAVEELAYIPSCWLGRDACFATQFYRSVNAFGQLSVLEDEKEKAEALELLMLKYQQDTTFKSIIECIDDYRKSINNTAIFCLKIEEQSIKGSLGEYLKTPDRLKILEELKNRNSGNDPLAIQLIKEQLGFLHQKETSE